MESESDRANPYEAPRSLLIHDVPSLQTSSNRTRGNICLRWSLLFLMIPAAYNIAFLSKLKNDYLGAATLIFLAINWLLLIVMGLLIGTFGLWLLELVTGVLHRCFSRRATRHSWNATLYLTLRSAPIFAAFGAITWSIWVFAFFELKWNFYLISIPAGILGHGLAAALYLPLFYRWYRLG